MITKAEGVYFFLFKMSIIHKLNGLLNLQFVCKVSIFFLDKNVNCNVNNP